MDRGSRRGLLTAAPVATAAVVVVVAAVAIRVGDGVSVESSATGDLLTDQYFEPGTPIADGITVPEGTRQAGPVFVLPVGQHGGKPTLSASVAVLDVSANPFDVWQSLVGQTRAIGAPLVESGAACEWRIETVATVAEAPSPMISFAPLTGTSAHPQARPHSGACWAATTRQSWRSTMPRRRSPISAIRWWPVRPTGWPNRRSDAGQTQ